MNEPTPGPIAGGIVPVPVTVNAGFHPLRTWPALGLVAIMVLARFGPTFLEGGLSAYWMVAIVGPLLCSVLILIWWLTASRATWKERLLGFAGLVVSLAAISWLVHPTMLGPGTIQLTLPMGMFVFAVGVSSLARHRPAVRTGVALVLAVVTFGVSLLLRNEGSTGDYVLSVHWRWSRTAEDRMLTARKPDSTTKPDRLDAGQFAVALANAEWPAFRGADRAGHARGPMIATNWAAHPPQRLWKIPVGPAWSSIAVAGKFLFTQEQRGPMETVVCYDADTGREVWIHETETRFDDPLGGPGPRATPTIAKGGLFVTGATGTFLRLDPMTGAIVWRQDLKAIAGCEMPMWGFSASPLVTGSVVIVHAGGPGDKGVLALDVESGRLRWSAAAGKECYSSPQLNTLAGESLVLMLSNDGLTFLDPATGKERLNYAWNFRGYRALQPHVVGSDTVLLPTSMITGTRAIRISKVNGQLVAQELWTSRNLNPDFTDLVSHQGYAYGVVGALFTCVDLKTGERRWREGRYGKGQVVLLEDSGLLLVAAEQGHVALLRADPGGHAEVASFQALEGKTWNHPVVVGDRLYVRNAQEAAGFQLPLAETKNSPLARQSVSRTRPQTRSTPIRMSAATDFPPSVLTPRSVKPSPGEDHGSRS